MFTAVRDLGAVYTLDDLSFITDCVHRQHHAAITQAFWTAVQSATSADARIDSTSQDPTRFTAQGPDRSALEDAVDEAAAAGYDAAQAFLDANKDAWCSKKV